MCRAVNRTSGIKMYKTMLKPVVVYGYETWSMTGRDNKAVLNMWEREKSR
jgi:hypothetical protein